MYKVVLSRESQRFYAAADVPLVRKLDRCFIRLETDPRSGNNVRALVGPLAGCFRYRVGDYRVVYTINEATRTVSVINIAHRRDVYE